MGLAATTLTAIARLTIVHRAILTRLRATRLICCETHGANRRCNYRKENLQIISHDSLSGMAVAKASPICGLDCCLAGIAFREYA
jgi:hypothetical protein